MYIYIYIQYIHICLIVSANAPLPLCVPVYLYLRRDPFMYVYMQYIHPHADIIFCASDSYSCLCHDLSSYRWALPSTMPWMPTQTRTYLWRCDHFPGQKVRLNNTVIDQLLVETLFQNILSWYYLEFVAKTPSPFSPNTSVVFVERIRRLPSKPPSTRWVMPLTASTRPVPRNYEDHGCFFVVNR